MISTEDIIENIVVEGIKEDNGNPYAIRCPSCRNHLSKVDLLSVSLIDGTNMMPTIVCVNCGSHIILSQNMMEKLNNDKKTNSSPE